MAESVQHEDSQTAVRLEPPRPWRFRWSLRVLIAVVSLVGLLFAWGAHYYRIGQTHDAVGQKLATIGTRVPTYSARGRNSIHVQWKLTRTVYHQTISDRNWNSFRSGPTNIVVRERIEKHAPSWMQATGTDLLFQRICSIRLDKYLPPNQFEAAVQEMARLDRVEVIQIDVDHLPHAQFLQIVRNVEVRELSAPRSKLKPVPIPDLRVCPLTELDLSHTWFCDATVADLPTSLQALYLERTAITDAGLVEFSRLTNLETLNLRRTPTSGQAIEQLRERMPWCEIFWEPLLEKHLTRR